MENYGGGAAAEGAAHPGNTPFAPGGTGGDPGAVQLLDYRGLGRAPTFSGERRDFETWAFAFESFVELLGWGALIDAAKTHRTEILNDALGAEPRNVSRNLFHLLVQVVRGHAQVLLRLVPRGAGLEAIRVFYREFRAGLAPVPPGLARALRILVRPALRGSRPARRVHRARGQSGQQQRRHPTTVTIQMGALMRNVLT